MKGLGIFIYLLQSISYHHQKIDFYYQRISDLSEYNIKSGANYTKPQKQFLKACDYFQINFFDNLPVH